MDNTKHCRNCGTELNGKFCSSCGQRDKDVSLPVKELVSEFIDEIPVFDERLRRSMKPFLFKPGFLTLEYLSGKRKHYLSPFKLYFFVSFLFFLFISLDDSETKYVTGNNLTSADSASVAAIKDTIYTLVNGKKSGLKFTILDSAKAEKALGANFTAGLQRMKDNPQLLFDKIKEYRPKIIFLLLPVFALLLKLLYIRSKTFYIRHLVFAFYFHAFVFVVLLCVDLLELIPTGFFRSYSGILLLVVPVNLYFAMKRIYQQSAGKTLIKFSLLSMTYSFVFFITFLIAMLIFLFILYL